MIQFALTLNEQELELLQLALAAYEMELEHCAAGLIPRTLKDEYRTQAVACDDLYCKSLNVPPIGVTEDFNNV